ncbi:sarcosine oxidase subunit gamma [Sulfitobacter sp. SK012]|uniref:sarcosine oxidase subunit gamma n=1 Tax=Sulfitobacter sp. SK012 TaxID=1389005 RepID=UPI000E0C0A05|nr:sarcosine oxidase subunit gamma family protein [Sulfitobacter sp. SK012]AXI47291.1 sarcosine oxidase subunit gamma [Sulfitobacter sp. SK012]
MSEPVTALKNAAYTAGIAEVSEVGPVGMITLRGDLNASHIRKSATSIASVDFPEQRHCNSVDERGIAWMSPDELLVMCPYVEVPAALEKINKAVEKHHALAANVSDARAVFQVSGPHAREVMAKLCPVDLHPGSFTPGMFRRTRMAQVPAAFWMRDAQTFQVICFRSVGQYVFDLLKIAAQPTSEVGVFPQ